MHRHSPLPHQPSTQPGPHHHVATLEDGLAFLNTASLGAGRPVDLLPDLHAALAWLEKRALVHDDALQALTRRDEASPELAARDLARAHRIRAALRALVDAAVGHRPPPAEDLAIVNAALRSPARYELVLDPDGVTMGHRHEGDPLDGALALLAETVARGVSQDDAWRLRVCANDACRLVFVDRSPGGRRKWCDMATCGNRAKAARHRARQRAASA